MNERQQDQKWVEDTRSEYLRRADASVDAWAKREIEQAWTRNYKEVFGS